MKGIILERKGPYAAALREDGVVVISGMHMAYIVAVIALLFGNLSLVGFPMRGILRLAFGRMLLDELEVGGSHRARDARQGRLVAVQVVISRYSFERDSGSRLRRVIDGAMRFPELLDKVERLIGRQ